MLSAQLLTLTNRLSEPNSNDLNPHLVVFSSIQNVDYLRETTDEVVSSLQKIHQAAVLSPVDFNVRDYVSISQHDIPGMLLNNSCYTRMPLITCGSLRMRWSIWVCDPVRYYGPRLSVTRGQEANSKSPHIHPHHNPPPTSIQPLPYYSHHHLYSTQYSIATVATPGMQR